MTDRGHSRSADGQILIAIEPADFIQRHSQGLSGHRPKIVGGEPLPTGFRRKIQSRFVDESRGLEANPRPPIQLDPGTDEYRLPLVIDTPFTLVQRIPRRIRCQNASPVRPIKHQVPRGMADHSPVSGFQACFEEEIFGKRHVSGRRERRDDGIGWHYGHGTTKAESLQTASIN